MFDVNKLKDFKDTEIVKVECPEWKEIGDIYVRSMTGASRDTYDMGVYEASQLPEETRVYNMRAEMVVATACDKEGNLVFKPSDAKWLGNKSGKAIDRLYTVARKLAGVSKKDVAEMEKSLKGGQS